MIHSAPTIDFTGSILVHQLETGMVHLNEQDLPAVRVVIQHGRYPYNIIATAHEAGELYAYCLAAHEKQIDEISVKISCVLLPDVQGNLINVATTMAWYASAAVREKAVQNLVCLLEGNKPGGLQNFKDSGMLARLRN